MIFIIAIVASCILIADPSDANKKRTFTPEEQFQRINIASRKLNMQYSKKTLKMKNSGRRADPVLEELIGNYKEVLESLGLGKTTGPKVPNVRTRRLWAPRFLTSHRFAKKYAENLYKSKCSRKRHCNVGVGIFGGCFTNAIKFAMQFGWKAINSVLFDKTEKAAVVVYPSKICSVVWKLEQKIMNFFFGKCKRMKVKETAAFSTVLSAALKVILKIIENESMKQKDCSHLPGYTVRIGNGSLVNCYSKCTVCGFRGITPLPEIEVTPDSDEETAIAIIPWQVPKVTVHITQENPDGSEGIVKYNVDDINVHSNVSFDVGDEFKFKEVNIDLTKMGGLEEITNNAKLTEEQKNRIKSAIGKVVQQQLINQMNSLNGNIGKQIHAEIRKRRYARSKGG